MTTIVLLLVIGALVCFCVAAFKLSTQARVDLVALGLALWVAAQLVGPIRSLT